MPEKEIQGLPAPPDTKSWFEYSWKLQQDVPNRFEDAAKFLATIISLTITIVFTALDKLKIMVNPLLLSIMLFIWLIALFFAFFVLFPHKYAFHQKSIESIKTAQGKIVRKKRLSFIVATVLYFLPLLLLAILYFLSITKTWSHYEKRNVYCDMPIQQGPQIPGSYRSGKGKRGNQKQF